MPQDKAQTLIDQLNAGSEQALEGLFRLFYGRLVSFARQYLFDTDAAKDVVQELFVYLWERRGHIRPAQKVSALLLLAVRNRCINYINHQACMGQYIERIDTSALATLTAIDMARADDLVSGHELRRQLDDVLLTLTPGQRQAFVRVRLEGHTLRETAEEMEVSISMVDKWVRKGADKVTRYIQQHYPVQL